MKLARTAPWLAALCALLGAASGLRPARELLGMDLDAFARLPVLEAGRVKPIDSVARNSLLILRGQQGFRHQGRTVGAAEWLLDVLFRPAAADAQPVFVIDDPDVLGLLGLPRAANRYHSFAALAPHLAEIEKQAKAARPIDARQRTRFQRAIAQLSDRVVLYYRLRNTVQLQGHRSLPEEIAARAEPDAGERHDALAHFAAFRPLPPAPGRSDWRGAGEALREAALDPALEALALVGSGYASRDAARFDAGVAGLRAAARPEALRHAEREALFNRAQPFYAGMVIYLLALLSLFASWLWKPAVLRPTSFALSLSGALVHTAGLAARVLLQGRPPVTNLYSSAVFVGFCAVAVGILLERLHRRGFGTAVASAAGFASLIVAHHLARDGDTLEMMRAVLDSNFWLATHVVAITVGYSGTFVAGALAIGYAAWRHLGRAPDPVAARALSSMAYGAICFALFFSFVGTVLGGIWADQSWGRFWGWDPKENGALLIVLWNAIILHARWGGYVREQGLMAMAIFGNVITSLSWFGVNMLGVGLHSYGFMDSAFWALSAFVASQLAVLALCSLPRRFWRRAASVRATQAPRP